MDKELSIAEIWQFLAIGVGLCIFFGAVWRWLLPFSYLFALMPLSFAWTEWFDPSVGPDIAREAGPDYGSHVTAAILFLQCSYILAWFISRRFSVVAFVKRASEASAYLRAAKDLVFAVLFLLITLLGASAGFGPGSFIWRSPPMLLAAAFLVFVVWRTGGVLAGYFRERPPTESLE